MDKSIIRRSGPYVKLKAGVTNIDKDIIVQWRKDDNISSAAYREGLNETVCRGGEY